MANIEKKPNKAGTKIIPIIFCVLLAGYYLFFKDSKGSNNNSGNNSANEISSSKEGALNINNEVEITNFLQGKWTLDNTAKDIEYRVEIIGNRMKLYDRVAGENWKSEPTAERKFSLGTPTMDLEKYYHVRYLEFDQGDLPLSFRAWAPVWVVCDEKWGEPAIPYGGGFTYFKKGWD